MKTKFFLYLLLLIGLNAALISCSDDEGPERPLVLTDTDYTLTLGTSLDIVIASGNRKYDITVEDPRLLSYEFTMDNSDYGRITLTGKNVGSTVVTIVDRRTNERESLSVDVTYHSLSFRATDFSAMVEIPDESSEEIWDDMLNRSTFKEGSVISFVRSERPHAYVFNSAKDAAEGNSLISGRCRLATKDSRPYLYISYDENGLLYTEWMLEITGGNGLEMLAAFLGTKWVDSRALPSASYSLHLELKYTTYYQTSYPKLKKAAIEWTFWTVDQDLPVELLQ